MADRYVLRGLPAPVITPPQLSYLEQLIRVGLKVSKHAPDRAFWIESVSKEYGRVLIYTFRDGEKYSPDEDDSG